MLVCGADGIDGFRCLANVAVGSTATACCFRFLFLFHEERFQNSISGICLKLSGEVCHVPFEDSSDL